MTLQELLRKSTEITQINVPLVVDDKSILIPFLRANYHDTGVEHGHTLASAHFAKNQGIILLEAFDRFVLQDYDSLKDEKYARAGNFSGIYLPVEEQDDALENIDAIMKYIKETQELMKTENIDFKQHLVQLGNGEKQEFRERYNYKLRRSLVSHFWHLDDQILEQEESFNIMDEMKQRDLIRPDSPIQVKNFAIGTVLGFFSARHATDFTQRTFYPLKELALEQLIPQLAEQGYQTK